jgi:hypothetical protein
MSQAKAERREGTESESVLIRAGISYNYTIFDILSLRLPQERQVSTHPIISSSSQPYP